MSKVLLISPNMEKNPLVFPLGIGYIRAGLIKAGHQCGVLDFAHLEFDRDVLTQHIELFRPDFIGVSIRNLDNCCMRHPRSFVKDTKCLLQWIHQWNSKCPIILGGAGFSLLPAQWLAETDADYGIVGDGTVSFPLLIDKLKNNECPKDIAGLIYYDRGKLMQWAPKPEGDLDYLPFPSREGFIHPLYKASEIRHNVQTKRGCGQSCLYCAYPSLEGYRIRLRSSLKIADELQQMVEQNKIVEFDFVDSVFNYPMTHAESICREITARKLKLSWGCFLHPTYISEQFLRLLKEAGCSYIEYGIDSGSEKCLRSMKKNFGKEEIKNACLLSNKAGIEFNFCLLIGGPGETLETLHETLCFMEECGVGQGFGLMGIRILPHTGIFDMKSKNTSLEELLEPKFYFSEDLNIREAEEEIEKFKANNPGWIFV